MHLLSLHLQAQLPQRNLFRFYHVWMGQDLLGDWTLEITYGRIGARGTNKVYLFASEKEALKKLKTILARRASAHKRLGCAYRLVECHKEPCLEEIHFACAALRVEPFTIFSS